MDNTSKFLILAAAGLTPIALSYGLIPSVSLGWLFGISIENINGRHIFRAIMGLYLALSALWLLGAFIKRLQQHALVSLIVFMFGLAAGRLLSISIDGFPHWLLFLYTLLEIAFGSVGLWLYLQNKKSHKEKTL
ncbi:DUF4345 domain-containing protein [Desulfobaculum bizertense]|uniref:DUF4345 domain-containing protein n=1 Tax=Desulfobaculum bizertense TaxID=376490 RepID=UPI001F1741E0|nr:DUF4345 domain-containing protein [Desulfobaculum bizertense]UIJ38997.1 DUF4345 domain-containing protein [Desulfobaculum bizertense]